MLEFGFAENKWNPPELSDKDIKTLLDKTNPQLLNAEYCLIIFQAIPFIDSILVSNTRYVARFTFHENYIWSSDNEELFVRACLLNPMCRYTNDYMDEIYEFYSKEHPEWHLNRYNTASLKLLDHIYHCLKKNTAKEMLYKSGLDVLAVNFQYGEHINLLATKPSDLYGGLSMIVLRALNCEEGASLLTHELYYPTIRKLHYSFPDIFKSKLNNAQVAYIRRLIDGNLTINELGRIYNSLANRLSAVWIDTQYDLILHDDKLKKKAAEIIDDVCAIDPIYSALRNESIFDKCYYNGTIDRNRYSVNLFLYPFHLLEFYFLNDVMMVFL